ncbi:MAG: DUF3343 domain-containing protein [Thermodesulfobacteriota bacterium]|nr:DUF3343 domain-containing protein [Thermodesulfobacteriota bacterium]
MSSDKETVIFILPSIHHVLRGEKVLEKAGLSFDLIPVPKEVNPDCGMALETDPALADKIKKTLVRAGLEIEAVYRRQGRTSFLKT